METFARLPNPPALLMTNFNGTLEHDLAARRRLDLFRVGKREQWENGGKVSVEDDGTCNEYSMVLDS